MGNYQPWVFDILSFSSSFFYFFSLIIQIMFFMHFFSNWLILNAYFHGLHFFCLVANYHYMAWDLSLKHSKERWIFFFVLKYIWRILKIILLIWNSACNCPVSKYIKINGQLLSVENIFPLRSSFICSTWQKILFTYIDHCLWCIHNDLPIF